LLKLTKPKISKHWLFGISIAISILLIALLSFWIHYIYTITVPKNDLNDTSKLVVIKKGDSVETIAKKVGETKTIRSSRSFGLYAHIGPAHGKLLPGTYEVVASHSIKEIVADMAVGRFATRKVIVPEGLNILGVAAVVERNGVASKAEFLKSLSETYDSKALVLRPVGIAGIEGMLAPGTYQMLVDSTPHDLVAKMLDHYYDTSQEYATKKAPQNLTFYQATALASILEQEAGNTVDRKKIAGVFYNRLKAGMMLQTDTTTFYINDLKSAGLITQTIADNQLNTYKFAGLPKYPICNPSLDSINAAYNPTVSDNLYFIGDGHGHVYYAKTYAEHQANIARYL